MDDTVFKPHDYDPFLFIDIDQAITTLLSSYSLDGTDVTQLPASEFISYVKTKESLNLYQIKQGVSNYIGNKLIYLSAGETASQYVTGDLVTPTKAIENIFNRYHPTVNYSPKSARVTYAQIGGLFTPSRISPITYISINPKPFFVTEEITPGTVYILPDPSMYGSGFGNYKHGHNLPIDHREDVTWLTPPHPDIGMRGRIHKSNKLPLLYNYTSKEHTLTVPQHGINKFTDSYDFWDESCSLSGSVWSNRDIYKLVEANKFYITERQVDLATDICDTQYNWRTDIYGNEYIMYKKGTTLPKKTGGGSDLDGDGKDDQLTPGDGSPDYGNYDGSPDGTGPPGGRKKKRKGPGGGGTTSPSDPPPTNQCIKECKDSTGKVIKTIVGKKNSEGVCEYDEDCGTKGNDPEKEKRAGYNDQIPLRECKYWLWGGNTLSPTDSAVNLDIVYGDYTTAGAVTAIIDGGFRPLRTGSVTTYTPAGTAWQIRGNVDEDQTENQFQVISAGVGYTGHPDDPTYCNGFFDYGMHRHQTVTNTFNTASAVEWSPDYMNTESHHISGSRNYPRIQRNHTDDPDYTVTFTRAGRSEGWSISNREDGDFGWRGGTDKVESASVDTDPAFVVADGGWWQIADSNTFFRSRCDRASYILAYYGGESPEWDGEIWACKVFDITNNPSLYIEDSQPDFEEQRRKAATRGPLNATVMRNPIQNKVLQAGVPERKLQFFGTEDRLKETFTATGVTVDPSHWDFLQPGEAKWLRRSPIEGSGAVESIEDHKTTALFLDVSTDGTLDRPGIRGTPDIFYYVSGGQWPDQTSPTLLYSTVKATVSYIQPSLSYNDPSNISLGLKISDIEDNSVQFPNVPHDSAFSRLYDISVRDYNNLGCKNVAFHCNFVLRKVYPHQPQLPEAIVASENRPVPLQHPDSSYHGQTFLSKRGYFPPPVGDQRRQLTETHALSAGQIGSDMPFPDNMMPSVTGFYVHDVWDSGHFTVDAGDIAEVTMPGKPPEGPPEKPGPGNPGNDQFWCCQNKETHVLPYGGCCEKTVECGKWVKMGPATPGGTDYWCTHQCGTGYRQVTGAGGLADGLYRCEIDPDFGKCPDGDAPPCPGGPGTCLPDCTPLTGGKFIDPTCSDYSGYDPGEMTQGLCDTKTAPPEGETPLYAIANMVKRASDKGDSCNISLPTPTLWEQKHTTQQRSLTGANNIYYRNIYSDDFGSLDNILKDSLFAKYSTFINKAGEEILRDDRPFINVDVIYDTLILRQSPGHDYQTYIFEKVDFNYTTGKLEGGDISTNYIKADTIPNSQLLCHYFNEDNNTIIAGVTRELSAGHIYPELYKLDLSDHSFNKIFPKTESDISLFQTTSADFSANVHIQSIDPGEITYNPQTNHYNVTYFASVSVIGQDYDNTPVIFTHTLTEVEDKFNLIDARVYHSEDKTFKTTPSAPSETLLLLTSTVTALSAETSDYYLTIDLDSWEDSNAPVLYLDIDWNDGEVTRIWRDLDQGNRGVRYRGDEWLSNKTWLNAGSNDKDGATLTKHKIRHSYSLSGTGTYNIGISGYTNANTMRERQLILQSLPYTIDSVASSIKLLGTKLYTPTLANSSDTLLLTLESQDPRYVTHSIIEL